MGVFLFIYFFLQIQDLDCAETQSFTSLCEWGSSAGADVIDTFMKNSVEAEFILHLC